MIQTAALRTIVAGFADQVALIVGDVMLDEYIWGDVRRISPEAPVPVVQTKWRTHRPGGAGNVAANVAALAGTPLLCGVVGDDAMAEYLASALREAGVAEVGGLLQAPGRPTTVKSRIMAHSQQMLRLDTEIGQPLAGDAEEHVLAWCARAIARAGVCIISDYAKGVLTSRACRTIIALANARGIPTIVDPKGRDYKKYAGARLITPNTGEAALALNQSPDDVFDPDQAAHILLSWLPDTSVLLTQGAAGMALYQPGQPRLHIPANARNVYDVTGAGDTVVAALALALAAGATLQQAAALANAAAGVAVSKVGTATVSPAELLAAIAG